MGLATRIGASFREELRQPMTRVYVAGSIMALVIGGVFFKANHDGVTHSMLLDVLRFFSPVLVVFPTTLVVQQFWKRFGTCLVVHALFLPVFHGMSHLAFVQRHYELALWFLLAFIGIEVAVMTSVLNWVFPQQVIDPSEEQKP